MPRFIIRVKLREILLEKKMSQRDLCRLTGLRPATVSEITNNLRTTVSKEHLSVICEALNIKDLREILEFIPAPQKK